MTDLDRKMLRLAAAILKDAAPYLTDNRLAKLPACDAGTSASLAIECNDALGSPVQSRHVVLEIGLCGPVTHHFRNGYAPTSIVMRGLARYLKRLGRKQGS